MRTVLFTLATICFLLGAPYCYAQNPHSKSTAVPAPKKIYKEKVITVTPPSLIRDLQVVVAINKVKYLNYVELDAIPGLYGDNHTTSNIAANFPSQHRKFHTYVYDDLFVIQTNSVADLATLNTNPGQNWELYYTLRALQILQTNYLLAYDKLINQAVHPNLTVLDNANYNYNVNKLSKVVISFTDMTNGIASSGTQLGQTSETIINQGQAYTVYNNLPILSINSTLIRGNDQANGSYPVYKRPQPDENFHLYMKEGLLHTIVHELIHRGIDIRNNDRRTVYNFLYFGSGRACTVTTSVRCPLYDFEEVVLIHTLNKYFRKAGGLSSELLTYYDDTATQIIGRIGTDYATYIQQIQQKSGYDSANGTYTLLD